jgi:hypothetical protein
MAIFVSKPQRRKLWLIIAGATLVTALAITTYLLRPHWYEKRFDLCLSSQHYDDCIALAKKLQRQNALSSRLDDDLAKVITAKSATLTKNEALQFVQEMQNYFPKLSPVEKLLKQLELDQLNAFFSVQPEQAAIRADELAKKYLNDATVPFAIAKMHLAVNRAQGNHLEQAVEFFARAIQLDKQIEKKYHDDEVIQSTLKQALNELPPSKCQNAYALIENYYLDEWNDFLRQNLLGKDNLILRNNVYAILNSAGKVTPEETWQLHWLNLLSATAAIDNNYRESTAYFEELYKSADPNSGIAKPSKLDFNFFPNLEKIPDYYLHETLALLLRLFPEPTTKELQKNLSDTKHEWRRVNSYYALKQNDLLTNDQTQRYHNTNLSLGDYEFFTDWLADSIEYISKQGEDGKNKLKLFVGRIVDLKKKYSGKPDNDRQRAYAQLEGYVRSKIGKKN